LDSGTINPLGSTFFKGGAKEEKKRRSALKEEEFYERCGPGKRFGLDLNLRKQRKMYDQARVTNSSTKGI